MQHKKTILFFMVCSISLALLSSLVLINTQPVSAQCGSQASSCKSCHEVQAEMPVNGDGTSWHTAHAFGDFCYICHAGNNQAKDKTEAHIGMVAPLMDVKASCQQCHPNDLMERSQVYATALGVEIGSGAAPAVEGEVAPIVAEPVVSAAVTVPESIEIDYDDPNLVNYSARYDEIVLGKKPINWGNMILLGMIGLVLVGGGGFVATREKLFNVKFGDVKQAGEAYPAEVVDMLPAIANLKSNSRKTLKRVLDNPHKAEKILSLVDAVISDEKSEE